MSAWRILKLYVYILVIIMAAPILITFPVAITTTGYMTFPPVGFTLSWFTKAFQDKILLESLIRSLYLALASSVVSVFIALLSSFAIERGEFPGKSLVETFFSGPRMIPLIIFVLALLFFYEWLGLAETLTGLMLSHLIISLPFAFRTLLVSVCALDRRLEWSAQILGANSLQTFFRVTLPQIKTGMIAAFIFTFILSFNNVTMALFLSGVGKRTLPVEMFQRLHVGGITPKIPAISFALSIIGLFLFIVADKTVGVFKYLGGGSE
ncbi:MAG: ABC transporter permease [Deltaproteobacteria bacterium]|nr:ABC transporter permease [Deltaproteobacteria bacterium]